MRHPYKINFVGGRLDRAGPEGYPIRVIDLERTKLAIAHYLDSAGGKSEGTIDQHIGPHMIDICEAAQRGDLTPDNVMCLQMYAWAKARGLLRHHDS